MMMSPETSMIDRLFLELSQFSQATTARELALERENKLLRAQQDSGIPAPKPWLPMETAPRNGTTIEALARLPTASAGFPQYISFTDGAWYTASYTRHLVVPWAWRPRENFWPEEGTSLEVPRS